MHNELSKTVFDLYINVYISVTSLVWKSVSGLWIFITYMNWNGIQAAQALEAVWLCHWYLHNSQLFTNSTVVKLHL